MDARSLLRAKREQAKVDHPYASYASGHLKCTVCGAAVKDGAAWDGHLGSKAHRKNLARVREEQRAKEEAAAQRPAKRPAARDEDEVDEHDSKKRRVDAPDSGAGFPANFFSDPSRAVPAAGADDDDDMDTEPAAPAAAAPATSELDLEWDAFQRNVINADIAAETREESFARATVVAEPELVEELPQGFPAELAERRAAARAALEHKADDPPPPPEETEAQKRLRREQEDKELIMDRILEEERLQEEADNKVAALKVRYFLSSFF